VGVKNSQASFLPLKFTIKKHLGCSREPPQENANAAMPAERSLVREIADWRSFFSDILLILSGVKSSSCRG
jgi:hypothetical protein